MQLLLLGVRGSTPCPGADYVRYGGNTACIAVLEHGDATPRLLLDAGTGLRQLSSVLVGRAFRGAILVSHVHWDHVQGLPFFGSGDRPDSRVRVLMPAQNGASGEALLSQAMSPPAFPITPEGLQGQWSFEAVDPGRLDVEDFAVSCVEVAHKGGRTFAWRIERDGASVVYLPDHAPSKGVSDAVKGLIAGADVLVHDAQFVEAERRIAAEYGHATIEDAIALARETGVGHLVLFHHSPGRKDDDLDRLAAQFVREPARGGLRVSLAREQDRVEVTHPVG